MKNVNCIMLWKVFERESRREKILEAKFRELKLKVKTKQDHNDERQENNLNMDSETFQAICQQIEKEYLTAVEQADAGNISENKS